MYLLPSVKVGSKTNTLCSKIWWPCNNPLAICTGSCHLYDQPKSCMVKGIDNACDHMELCLVYKQSSNFLEEIGFYFPEITLTTEFPGSNVLLPTFSIGGK